MSFILQNFVRHTSSYNSGEVTLADSSVVGGPAIFSYANLNDTVATIAGANYFSGVAFDLSVNDLIFVTGSDASGIYQVSAVDRTVNPPTVSVVSYGVAGTVGTANIQNNAVTYAKMQQASADTLLGNPTGSGANIEEITLGAGLVFNSTTLTVDPLFLNEVEISMTAAQWNGMYATPVQVIAAPGANKAIIVDKVLINMSFGTTQFASGGVVGLQYGNTAHLAGSAASATEQASDFTGAAASTLFAITGGLSTGAPTANAANAAVYISNATGAFTTGDSTFKVRVWYKVVPTNS